MCVLNPPYILLYILQQASKAPETYPSSNETTLNGINVVSHFVLIYLEVELGSLGSL